MNNWSDIEVNIHKHKIKNPTENDFWLDKNGFLKYHRESRGWITVAILSKDNPYLIGLHNE